MKKVLLGIVALVLLGAAIVGFRVYSHVTHLASEQITDDLYMITGFGGNVAALRTDVGTVVVDTMLFPIQGDRIALLAEELTGQPVTVVINTHYHQDHTHGNPGMAPGTKVISTARTLEHLLAIDGEFWKEDNEGFLPTDTFDDEQVVAIGGKTLRLVHPGRAHTDGDLVVLFVEDRTIHIGDLMFNGTYPNIDLEGGGSVQEWPAALLRVLELDFDHVIPGHGTLADREAVRSYERFMEELGRMGRLAASREWTLEQAQAEIELTRDEELEDYVFIPRMVEFKRDFVIQRAWEEATGAVTPRGAASPEEETDSETDTGIEPDPTAAPDDTGEH